MTAAAMMGGGGHSRVTAAAMVGGHRRVTAAALMGGYHHVTAAAVMGGQFAMIMGGAQLCKSTTLLIGELKTWRVARKIVRSYVNWKLSAVFSPMVLL